MPIVYSTVAVESEVEIEFEAWCSDCGAGICGDINVEGGTKLKIEPCDNCLTNAKIEGYNEGYNEGYEKGHDEGYETGYEAGCNTSIDS